ncbi:hypothetical protein [Anabaena sp. CCY 0017]
MSIRVITNLIGDSFSVSHTGRSLFSSGGIVGMKGAMAFRPSEAIA